MTLKTKQRTGKSLLSQLKNTVKTSRDVAEGAFRVALARMAKSESRAFYNVAEVAKALHQNNQPKLTIIREKNFSKNVENIPWLFEFVLDRTFDDQLNLTQRQAGLAMASGS